VIAAAAAAAADDVRGIRSRAGCETLRVQAGARGRCSGGAREG